MTAKRVSLNSLLSKQNQQLSLVMRIKVILECKCFYFIINQQLSRRTRDFFILWLDQQSSQNAGKHFLEKYKKAF